LLVLYGLGTTVGAGVYALIGIVAGQAGLLAPLAFLLASVVAALSALSFAELSARHPRAAGEAEYVSQAFGRPALALAVGLAVATSGIISAAAVSRGFAGYLGALVAIPPGPAMAGLIAVLGGIAVWGIRESLVVAAGVTLLEVGGLLVLMVVGASELGQLPSQWSGLELGALPWLGVLQAATLAFFAFLGFEDMVNVAEEVRDVRTTLPRAIIWTLVLTTGIYVCVALVSVAVVPPEVLADAEAPLVLVLQQAGGGEGDWLASIGMLAMLNGALIQIVMAARVLYGLARRGWIPRRLARVNARTGTPVVATVGVSAIVLGLALANPLAALARATSLVALCVFAAVNASLVVLQRREAPVAMAVPGWVPRLGAASCLALVLFEGFRAIV
jgi:amino acid transporter